jgi:sugar (pentulose or hexulose) kinase
VSPRQENARAYDRLYAQYRALYPALKPIFTHLSSTTKPD